MRAALLKNAGYPCPYLPGRLVRMEQFLVLSLSLEEHEELLKQGFRHFGAYYFRPACEGCARCVPLRFKALKAREHRSWRRLLSKSSALSFAVDEEIDPDQAFRIYRLHKERFSDGESPDSAIFRESFFSAHPTQHYLTIRDDGRLVAVAHFDWTDSALSAIYTYYDHHDYGRYSPGKLAILKLKELAVGEGIENLYLGYYVHGNRAMSYKAAYTPFEYSPFAGHWSDPLQSLEQLRFFPGESLLSDPGYASPEGDDLLP